MNKSTYALPRIQQALLDTPAHKKLCCIPWPGPLNSDGRPGMRHYQGKPQRVSRIVYQEYKGEIPKGFVIDHLCCNQACINPLHLEMKTQRLNILRSGASRPARQARQTHCKNGHPFTTENTISRDGSRICRQCHTQWRWNYNRAYYRKNRAQILAKEKARHYHKMLGATHE